MPAGAGGLMLIGSYPVDAKGRSVSVAATMHHGRIPRVTLQLGRKGIPVPPEQIDALIALLQRAQQAIQNGESAARQGDALEFIQQQDQPTCIKQSRLKASPTT